MSRCMISSGHLSWLAQNLAIWFRNRGCRLPHFELASAECSILCLLLNMCSKRSAARCQTELLAVAWTGSPTASPKSLAKLASSRHPEHGQRLTGYVGNSETAQVPTWRPVGRVAWGSGKLDVSGKRARPYLS